MDVRFTPLVGPTCHSPLPLFPPFFFLQEGASHGAKLPPAVCRPLREARRHGAELPPPAARSARRPHPRHGLEPAAASSGAAAGLGVEEGRRGRAGSAAAGLGPRRGGGAAAALPGSGALLPRRRGGGGHRPPPPAAQRLGLTRRRERGVAGPIHCRRARHGVAGPVHGGHGERACRGGPGAALGEWGHGAAEERRERDGAVTGERHRVTAERSQLEGASWEKNCATRELPAAAACPFVRAAGTVVPWSSTSPARRGAGRLGGGAAFPTPATAASDDRERCRARRAGSIRRRARAGAASFLGRGQWPCWQARRRWA
ncbi:hypothetical protein PVAP13_7NG380275 [Panicum virgatum]|uniref:Uncharacterized protein n=1 Tax=Panicum virgatum TaxID=38727 RepID=A0A8T0Q5Y6_PANVG|nr:hypothetical protein PVAP13_7NG380275 [Panicum virgatum]